MRVDVAGLSAHQIEKNFELVSHFALDGGLIVQANDCIKGYPAAAAINPFAQIEMETEAKLRMGSRVEHGFAGRQPPGHQTRAGDNPMLVRFDNAPVYAWALAKVVGVHDQVFTASQSELP